MRRLYPAFLAAGFIALMAVHFPPAPAAAQSRVEETPAPAPDTPSKPQIPVTKNEPGAPEIPSRRAECAWTGQRIVSLLWRDDVNTAREQSRFYEMFGCPHEHLPAAFRCVIEQSEAQPENADLNARVYSCWMDPARKGTQE